MNQPRVIVPTPADMRDAVEAFGTTAGGLPYPESTDPLNQGANAIKALATSLDTLGWANRLEARVVSVSFAGGVCTANFATAFAAVPMVIWSPGYPFGTSNLAVSAGLYSPNQSPPITLTGFSLICYTIGPTPGWYAGAMDVYYMAVGKK